MIDGMKRWVIDTEGLADGNSISSVQIQNLASLLRDYSRGVNTVVVVLNGQADRFSQGVKDLLKFTYNAFSTKSHLKNICIVFTKCYSLLPNQLNREIKKTHYKEVEVQYLKEISCNQEDFNVPIFFVDSHDFEG